MLSENLKRLRKEQRYNKTELGKLVGCTAATITAIEENRNTNPGLQTVINLAKVLKVSVNTLIK